MQNFILLLHVVGHAGQTNSLSVLFPVFPVLHPTMLLGSVLVVGWRRFVSSYSVRAQTEERSAMQISLPLLSLSLFASAA